ncbi:MAG: accessory Sec system translocase SecA2, partial [Staphylococcus sp.]|nr:accessory Sec system translocase SecA2 [Staphylococcus sp.]
LQTMDASKLESSALFKKRVKSIVNKAQRVSEETAMKNREMANEFEKSISVQRDKIYAERNHILEASDFDDFNFEQLARDVFTKDVKNLGLSSERALVNYIYENLSFIFDEDVSNINMQNDEEIIQFLIQQFTQQFNNRLEIATDSYLKLRFIQKSILKAIDSEWIEQVDNLQQLKASVNNRQNGQRNVIFEYHKVALETYEYMSEDIKRKMVRNLCLSILTFDKDGDMVIHFP